MRAYRHRPFLVLTVLCLLLVAVCLGLLVDWVSGRRDIESAAKAMLFAVPLLAFGAFLVLSWRWRTVVDDAGVTQHWITSRYRMPFGEITAVDTEHDLLRWYLRVHCGERTYEVIPCHTVLPSWLSAALGPPRTLVRVRAAIERARSDLPSSM